VGNCQRRCIAPRADTESGPKMSTIATDPNLDCFFLQRTGSCLLAYKLRLKYNVLTWQSTPPTISWDDLRMSDQTSKEESEQDVRRMTAEIVAAFLAANTMPATQLPELIRNVFTALKSLDGQAEETPAEPLKPAVPIRKSVTRDYIVCLEDGKKLKMLKRHLRTTYDMSPDEYRAKWGLTADYPMVAPAYAERRSEFAKKIGLGRKAAEPRKGRRART
jgi:predicted transcriptional regulator